MLSIDRVRVSALSLFGMVMGADQDSEAVSDYSGPDRDHGETTTSVPFAPRTPLFDAVETALRDAGYLDS
ncbi:MAG: hypothetical protein K2Y56_14255 [Methylobacterium sp.]|uniref:hypothetical protein n=1 Tax=Methylobacterium sp. TaxID=409 RepID=UPI0025DDD22A|nr:hypothetical protein [Methylobacterium sp.]MBX9932682.1 hypothetical protein [Methylobacterium sp.]